MLRVLGFAALVLVAACLAVGASIALGNEDIPASVSAETPTIEAVDLDRRLIDEPLAAVEDVYEFDFAVKPDAEPNPEVHAPSGILEI